MRFRAGWLIPARVLALTHFEPIVTPEDFKQIVRDTEQALQSVRKDQDFHVLIDNRKIADTTLVPLEMMLQALPQLKHPQLRWIVVVLPAIIEEQAQNLNIQQVGAIRLKYVNSLEEAFTHLSTDWTEADPSFFIATEVGKVD